jgi:hypothetical protein
MDLGSTVPLYVANTADISAIVVHNLNAWLPKEGGIQPAGGQK